MRRRIVILAAAALVVLAGCNVVPGSARAATETRQVSGFTKIDLSGVGEVVVRQGDSEALTIEADDNVVPNLTSDVVDGTLKLDRKPIGSPRCPGSGEIVVDVRQELRVDISGSGSVTYSGEPVSESISGSGRLIKK